MKFVIIFGPQAVGKMTVGQELARKTGVEKISDIFTSQGASVYYVELEADTEERLRRNQTPN